ncbi:MAG: ABC transporter ATP-binding protein [Minisyncoccia bacterium]|jgi:ABC-type multidrug transport system fused ATPase/permease subunit
MDHPMPVQKPSAIRRVIVLLKDHKLAAAFLLVLITIAQGANIAVPFIIKVLIDALTNFLKVGGALPWNVLIYSGIGMLAATVVGSAIQSSYNYHLFKLVTTVEDRLRHAAFEKYLQLHTLFHHGSSSGQIIGRIERGGTSAYVILNDIVGQNLLPPLIIFIGSFAALLYQNVWIALAILVPFPIYFFATQHLSNRIYLIEQRANDAFENVSKEMYDVAGNVLTVKKFSQEKAEAEHKKGLLAAAREIQYSAERLWGVIENVQAAIATVGRVAVLGLSAWFVFNGTATIGDFVLFITLQNMAYQPLSQLSIIFPRLRRNATRVERMFAILDEPVRVTDKKNAPSLPPLKRQIAFRNVSFGYRDREPALKNINLIIPAGKTFALVGRSGSGKTTFINLLLRSFDPQKGRILIDGVDIRDVTQESLRRQIAVVPQEVDLFSRTVAQNIAYGRPTVTQAQIENAARTALAHDFIMKLEHGYDTVVGERGIKLSGGERQRVGIARAVLRDPRILILDEATSHLDTESERLITEATNALIQNRTSIVIAHRLSTILNADTIVVFKNNEIEATGSHKELLKKSPTYRRLYELQFSRRR